MFIQSYFRYTLDNATKGCELTIADYANFAGLERISMRLNNREFLDFKEGSITYPNHSKLVINH